MLTGNTQFEFELKNRISEEIERVQGILLGTAIPDFPQYRFTVGYMNALVMVRDSYCEEVQDKIKQR